MVLLLILLVLVALGVLLWWCEQDIHDGRDWTHHG